MKYFPQINQNDCQIVAIKTVLSNFDISLTDKEIKKDLPKHTFGNLITEIGIYFQQLGFRTRLYSNVNNFEISNKVLLESLEECKNKGEFINKEVEESDITQNPVIINVNWYSIRKPNPKERAIHYIAIKKQDEITMFDGSNYTKAVNVKFEDLKRFCNEINRNKTTGMWLEISK